MLQDRIQKERFEEEYEVEYSNFFMEKWENQCYSRVYKYGKKGNK